MGFFVIVLVLVLVTAFAYAPVRGFEFVELDDPAYVSENPMVTRGLTVEGVVWAFTTGHAANWHPLTWLSHMLDVTIFGLDPGAHHLVSVALHLVATLLLFGLLVRLTRRAGPSAFVAALFALHPLHVESVAWIAERKDVLSGVFWMLTLWAWVAWVERPTRARHALALATFALGLMAKPMLVTLPIVLVLLQYWPLDTVPGSRGPRVPGFAGAPLAGGFAASSGRPRAGDSPRGPTNPRTLGPRALRTVGTLPFFVLAAASSVVTYLVQQRGGAMSGLDALPFGRRLANAVLSYGAYLWKTIWPADLSVLYPHPATLPAWKVALSLLVLAGISAFVLRHARTRPYLLAGWGWYVITLVPVIGLVQVGAQAMADRYTYIPLIGVFIMIAWGAADLAARVRVLARPLGAAALIVIVAATAITRAQVRHWENNVTLWTHAFETTLDLDPYRAHRSLAAALGDAGRTAEALIHLERAAALRPDVFDAQVDLGLAFGAAGRYPDAIAPLERAAALDPGSAPVRYNLGLALARAGRLDEAAAALATAAALDPASVETRARLGAVLVALGRLEDALVPFAEAVRLAPDSESARRDYAAALARAGRDEEALVQLRELIRINPASEEAKRAAGTTGAGSS